MGHNNVKVGITPGDINGIGPEIILKMFADGKLQQDITPILYGSSKVYQFYRKCVEGVDIHFTTLRPGQKAQPGQLSLAASGDQNLNPEPGQITSAAGLFALKALETAAADLKAGVIDVLVTAPLNKENVAAASPGFTGHTGWLATFAGVNKPLMILMNEKLRVGLVTEHLPISAVAAAVTQELLDHKIALMEQSLRVDFGIRKPRIAVLGMNPHAGDNGLIGDEEAKIIQPVIKNWREKKDKLVTGPFGADGFFGAGRYANHDGVLAMYHDQGLAPFKALSFGQGVNFTAGLPFVRTSPDHGTAYDMAGKGTASEESIRQAVYTACDVFKIRRLEAEITKNPLKMTEFSREK